MRITIHKTLAFAAMLAASTAAMADDPVGYVKTIQGNATITTAGSKSQAAVGSGVFQGSQIQTSKGASLGVTFKDNTIMSFGSDTNLTVDEYVFNPNQGQVKFGSQLTKGTLNYVSGAIAKINPEAVAVKTPTGTIGVRGTNFVVKVEAEE
jgi:hypothetical protein